MFFSVNMVFFGGSKVRTTFLEPFPIKSRHTKRVAIENLLFEKLHTFSSAELTQVRCGCKGNCAAIRCAYMFQSKS